MVRLLVLSIETIFDISYTTNREYDRKYNSYLTR